MDYMWVVVYGTLCLLIWSAMVLWCCIFQNVIFSVALIPCFSFCRPLIRILGDRFPWQVKSAILSTLTIIITKGGIALKPFLPQLQTTFVKCLQDNNRSVLPSLLPFYLAALSIFYWTSHLIVLNCRSVRTRAAAALGKLSALSTRVDPLVSDLLSMLQVVCLFALFVLSVLARRYTWWLKINFIFPFPVRRWIC